ncbi:MAG: hypothetical protein QOD35_905 [Nocardioidaceae bacterium]|nr:hypothetical protein [Nocardioidaceae bacterium]
MAGSRFTPRMTLPGVAVLLLVVVNVVLVFLVFLKDNSSASAPISQDAGGRLVKQTRVTAHPAAKSEQPQPSTSDDGAAGPAKHSIRLKAQSDTDKRYHALRLRGRYPDAQRPVTLNVQERIKHKWVTYPLPAVTDSSGRFSTFVSLARLGLARVRVVDLRTGLTSPVLTIRVTS